MIKGFIELTESKNLNKVLLKVDEIKLVDDNKIHILNVYLSVMEKYEDIKQLIKEATEL
jgi:hypothetical protein